MARFSLISTITHDLVYFIFQLAQLFLSLLEQIDIVFGLIIWLNYLFYFVFDETFQFL